MNQKPLYIYFILNKVNGKYYVGQTIKTPEKRWVVHQRDSRNRRFKNNHFSNAIRHYGAENFEVRILLVCYDQKTLDEAEIYFISVFDSSNPKVGYNAELGGRGGKKTEESKHKNADSHRGKKASSETRNKMSLAKKGRKQTPEHKRKRLAGITGKKRPADVVAKFNKKGRKRKPHSEETKQKMRVSALKRYGKEALV